MRNLYKIKFRFPLYLSENRKEGNFILEGFAAANDFDFQNDIISDQALEKAARKFKKQGKFCLNHTKKEIGEILDCKFQKGKIWVKAKITDPKIIKKLSRESSTHFR